jgi:PAS domain S-box-containing protein
MREDRTLTVLGDPIEGLLSKDDESIQFIELRARRSFEEPVIVWEGDPQTFQFSYVSPAAEEILGWPLSRWTEERAFWAEQVIVPGDRDEAVAYCALATGRRADHVFEYRARTASGRIVWLRDYVHVVLGPKGLPSLLRGLMIDVTAEKLASMSPSLADPRPSLAELQEP